MGFYGKLREKRLLTMAARINPGSHWRGQAGIQPNRPYFKSDILKVYLEISELLN